MRLGILLVILCFIFVMGCTQSSKQSPEKPIEKPIDQTNKSMSIISKQNDSNMNYTNQTNDSAIGPIEPLPSEPQVKSQIFEKVIPGKGAGGGPGTGPSKHRLKMAHSSDGLTWVRDTNIIADQASVPDAILDKDGNIRIYYVDWKNQGVTVAINTTNGWEYYRVKAVGKPFFKGVDPDVVLVNGTYRIYSTLFDSPGSEIASVELLFSDNGIVFDNKTTVFPRAEHTTDGDVFQTDSGWIMHISNGPQSIRTTSTDGLQFVKDGELSFKGSVSNTIKVPGGYRIYYHKNKDDRTFSTSIYSAFSKDGLNWKEEGLRLEPTTSEQSVESPAVIRLPDGNYQMFYHSMITD